MKLYVFFIAAAMLLIGGCSTASMETNPSKGESLVEIESLRAFRAEQFHLYLDARAPGPDEPVCVAVHFADGWYDSRFSDVALAEPLRDSLNAAGMSNAVIAAEVKRRNQTLVDSLTHNALRGEAVPLCALDAFNQIEVVLRGMEVQGVTLPRDVAVRIAQLGRTGENWVPNLSSTNVAIRQRAQDRLRYYATVFNLTDAELLEMGVKGSDVRTLRESP